ncbi:hypothetical protein KXJ69_00280 [Aureisphaera sp. CAU 1614]|uniref:Uncharacterized protein n=1 Tax=Halomarinibacterium sedimenti TaxID=2857106 RepID=A0A9X1FL91_9FLAO|nr:hypothetical protein [Halomarinibacterium sedimenti]MBW2936519.1 hypothetical protein [Halomarinibacterium sedimenti]
MKTLKLLTLFTIFFTLIACEKEEETEPEVEIEVNETSIIPSSTSGRPNNYLGCIEISSRITTIQVWDHGQIDGDIVSIIANGNTIINQQTLDGPSNPITVDYDFTNNGFNYITLFAHNLGDIPPNTCTIAINGVQFVLEANLDANGSIDVIVTGYGVDCSDAGGNGGGNGGGGNGNDTGSLIFYVGEDLGCGPISVNLSSVGSDTITGYYSSTPDCGASAGANFSNLDPGVYSYTASCSGIDWSGTVTIEANTCLRQQLLPGSGGGGGGGSGTGDVKFWINQDFGCGNISVNVTSVGSSTISGYFPYAPSCDNSAAGGNFNNLTPGTYSYNASCNGYTWQGNFTVVEDQCLQFQLSL